MNIDDDSHRPSIEVVLHGCLGTIFAVAVVVMALWPQVQALVA